MEGARMKRVHGGISVVSCHHGPACLRLASLPHTPFNRSGASWRLRFLRGLIVVFVMFVVFVVFVVFVLVMAGRDLVVTDRHTAEGAARALRREMSRGHGG